MSDTPRKCRLCGQEYDLHFTDARWCSLWALDERTYEPMTDAEVIAEVSKTGPFR